MINFNLKNKRACPAKPWQSGGFTLLEALVAISILMVAVAAPITIAQKGLSSAVYSKNQMIASYLAQDAIEYIINKRDNNLLSKIDWLDGLGYCLENSVCAVDTVSADGSGEIIDDEDAKLYRDGNGFYTHEVGGNTEVIFKRKINIIKTSLERKALITATVSWNSEELTVKTLIYNI